MPQLCSRPLADCWPLVQPPSPGNPCAGARSPSTQLCGSWAHPPPPGACAAPQVPCCHCCWWCCAAGALPEAGAVVAHNIGVSVPAAGCTLTGQPLRPCLHTPHLTTHAATDFPELLAAGAVAVTLVATLVLAVGSALVFGGGIGPNVLSCFRIAAVRYSMGWKSTASVPPWREQNSSLRPSGWLWVTAPFAAHMAWQRTWQRTWQAT